MLRFSKTGLMIYIGHLDLLKILQRAVARANLPVAFSRGFSPHQQMSFAMPLSLGMEGLGELVDVEFEEKLDPLLILEALNAQMPKGLAFTGCRLMADGEKSAASLVAAAVYEIVCDDLGMAGKCQEIAALSVLMAEKKTKSGISTVDVKPDIFELNYANGALSMTLAAGGSRNLKPGVVAKEFGLEGKMIKRISLLKRRGGVLEPIF